MPLDITCSQCGASFLISDDVAGKHFKCVSCKSVLKAPERARGGGSNSDNSGRQSTPEKPARRDQRPAKPLKRESRPPERLRKPPEPEPEPEYGDEDPFGYDGIDDASWNQLPARSSSRPARKKTRSSNLRLTNPDAFEEYDRICNELAIFWIGLAIIIGGLGGLLFGVFMDGAGDQSRQRNIVTAIAAFAGSSFIIGLVTFSHSRIWLYILYVICTTFLIASLALAIQAGCLLGPLPIAFGLMYQRIRTALAAHP